MVDLIKSKLPLTIRGVFLPNEPKTYKTPSLTHSYCFGIDWLEFTATTNLNELPVSPFLFTHVHSGHGSKYYNEVYNISTVYHGVELPFATMQVKPRPSFLDPHLVQIKLDNRFCYTPNIKEVILEFCREYGLTFKNITRLDLFLDMQRINYYGEDIQAFMQDCAARRIVLKGKSMRTHHTRNEVTGITWGVRSSGMSCTMYNKTEEMLKKSWKPWIEQLWREAQFDMEKDVYRLEFSMKKPKHDVVNAYGETISNFQDIELIDVIAPILSYCYHEHFRLAFNKVGERFSRLERFYPLMLDGTGFFSSTPCIKPKSTNYTKAYIKRLAVDALFYQKSGNILSSSFAYDHLMDVVERHSLSKWFHTKFYWLNLKKSHQTVFDHLQNQFIKTQHFTQSALDLVSIPFRGTPYKWNHD